MPIRKLGLGLIKKFKFLPDEFYMKVYYEYYTGKKLDLENPEEFNAKIQWLKIYYRPPILNQLVDKYAVRQYVEEKIGAEYLNTFIALYDRASEVDFDALPDAFVLKATHGYHFNLIVPDKSKLDRKRARYLLRKWQMKNQYWRGGKEWAYKDVPARFLAEEYLNELGKIDITDYKYFCFNGEPRFVQIDQDRATDHRRAFCDLQGNRLEVEGAGYKPIEGDLYLPPNFEKMAELARTLANRFPFVRVDFYNLNGRILFGEMTFYPGDGRLEFAPDYFNKEIGSYMQLPQVPEGQKYITEH